MAALDVSGDADNRQGVDAGQTEQEGEETVHLEGNKEEVDDSLNVLRLKIQAWLFQSCLSLIWSLFCFKFYQMETPQLRAFPAWSLGQIHM